MRRNILPLIITCFISVSTTYSAYLPQYYCTASDAKYYPLLLNLIGSIHNTNFKNLNEIAVFDIGLTQKQQDELKRIEKVKLYQVEMSHPDILTPIICREGERAVPGGYAWKHVIVKQALDMFPYVFYIDAGALILKPIDIFFEYLQKKGYFFKSGDKVIGDRITHYIRKKFKLDSPERKWILKSSGLESGFMGLSKKVYDNVVMPMYELTKDSKTFIPDNTVPKNFRSQSLYSIQVRLSGLKISSKPYHLELNNKKTPFEIIFTGPKDSTYVQLCRWKNKKDFTGFINKHNYSKCIKFKY